MDDSANHSTRRSDARRSAAWMDRAACRWHEHPNWWFPECSGDGLKAVRICRRCPVQSSCARYAIDTQRVDGIVAGVRLGGEARSSRDRARLEAIAALGDGNALAVALNQGPSLDAGPDLGPTGLPLLLPVPRVARLLGISRAAAYRLVASDQLPVRRMGGRTYVLTSELLRELGG